MADELESPAEVSALDRISAHLGLPANEPEPVAPTSEAAPEDAEIEWEGVRFKAPAKIKEALMKGEDYTRKTSELAEQRRALEQAKELSTQSQLESAFKDSVADEIREIALRDAYLARADKIDWGAMTMEQMVRQKHEIDTIERERNRIQKSVDDKRARFSDEMKSKFSELRAKSRELAAKSIPGFSEETEKAIRTHANSHGLTDQEVDSVLLDPRSAKILWEASQYAKVKAGTTQAVESATRVVKPGASNEKMPQSVVDKLNYNKAIKKAVTSGDKAQLIEARLMGMFGKGH